MENIKAIIKESIKLHDNKGNQYEIQKLKLFFQKREQFVLNKKKSYQEWKKNILMLKSWD